VFLLWSFCFYSQIADKTNSRKPNYLFKTNVYRQRTSHHSHVEEGAEPMQGRAQADQVQQGIDAYEQMMNTFAQQAKTFWKSIGPAGEPMAVGIESWVQMQRAYLQWLRQAKRASGDTLRGLTFDAWPGPGDSEGGGWIR
jgi:hypothetical protein